MRRLSKGQKGNKVEVERSEDGIGAAIIEQNDRYKDSDLCRDCQDEKKQIRRNIANMQSDEIERNRIAVTF